MSEEAATDASGFSENEGASVTGLSAVPKVVFSSTLQAPLTAGLVDRFRLVVFPVITGSGPA